MKQNSKKKLYLRVIRSKMAYDKYQVDFVKM